MSVGLFALLKDVSLMAKAAAASLDDVAAASLKATSKAAGVVIDDAAVTPKYVIGFAAERELPIIRAIALGSLKNKFFYILPAALMLGFFLPWLIHPILLIGGLYLSYEGAEKILSYLKREASEEKVKDEKETIKSAIRTDFILSAEIMALALSTVQAMSITNQFLTLSVVAFVITFLVYGTVAVIVKADDYGVFLVRTAKAPNLGKLIVKFMPYFLRFLTVVGTAAMLWVGGSIISHSIEYMGVHTHADFLHAMIDITGFVGFVRWLAETLIYTFLGLVIGSLIAVLRKARTT
jgi:predicted DNA repair protein MutK